ncbi:MAG TPA: hypothetical protein ENI23_12510 [bacterium]|nr:hypothetical protein [bacterium]
MEYNHIQKPLTSAQKRLWEFFGFFSILLLLLIQSFVLFPINTSAQGNSFPITKDLEVTLTSHAERFSDLEYWQYNPKGEEIDYRLLQSESDMLTDQAFKLGTQSDDPSTGSGQGSEGCVKLIDTRRTGTCEDGIYSFKMRSTDAAGNQSELGSYQIERDTVRPGRPDVSEPYLCAANICIDVSGELSSNLYVNNYFYGSINSGHNTYFVVRNWDYDTTYNFDIKLADRALNESEIVTKSIKTPPIPIGGTHIEGTATDPYGGKSGESLQVVTFNVLIQEKSGEYEISDVEIPAPVLTRTDTQYDKTVNIYGFGIEQEHKLEAKIYKSYMTYNEAKEFCDLKWYEEGWIRGGKKASCMRDAMGIDSLNSWLISKAWECGLTIPIYTNICMNKKRENDRVTRYEGMYRGAIPEVNNTIEKSLDDGDYSELAKPGSNKDGQFNYKTVLGEKVNAGNIIRAYTTISGEFEFNGNSISYNVENADGVLRSKDSNTLTIEAPLHLLIL